MLKHRIISGCLLGAMFILAAQYIPAMGVWVLLVVMAALAQNEYYAMLSVAKIPAFRIVGIVSGTALISATFFSLHFGARDFSLAYQWETLVLLATLIAVFVRQFPQKHNDQPLATIGCTLLGIWYVPYLFNFFTRLALGWGGDVETGGISLTGRMLVLYMIIVVKITDVGAFFVGSRFGRHKLFPRISPAKSWEGLFGGLAVAVLASLVFLAWRNWRLGELAVNPWHAVILGLLLALTGVVGDMFESLLKRGAGIKDSSSVIPGFGGLLDVLDSLLFGAPIMYIYARFFLT